jgi:hypothetical protein
MRPGSGVATAPSLPVPPDGVKADEYLSSLREAFPSSFPPERNVEKETETGGKSGRTYARVDPAEDLGGKAKALRGDQQRGSSSRADHEDDVSGGTGDESATAGTQDFAVTAVVAGTQEQAEADRVDREKARERHRRENGGGSKDAAGAIRLFETKAKKNLSPDER